MATNAYADRYLKNQKQTNFKTATNMKKGLVTAMFLLFCHIGFSQEIGVRFGDVVGNNVAVDAIFNTGEFNRVHADVSFGNGVGVEALWDFLYKPFKIGDVEGFKWYVGAGVSTLIDNPFLLGASAEGGIEYTFAKVPISLSGDWRPTLYILDDFGFHGGGCGFNARYVFGKSKK